jgi:hypothetical protein
MNLMMKFIPFCITYWLARKVYRRDREYKVSCLQIDNQINWINYNEEVIPALSGACYAVRSMVHISNVNTFELI